jgi:hypothetical protein
VSARRHFAARASDGSIEVGGYRLSIDARERDGAIELLACGGPTLPLLHEEARISTPFAALPPREAQLLAPYLRDHEGAAIMRFIRDDFGAWELRSGPAPHPFRLYSSALLAALERRDERSGLWLVERIGVPDQIAAPIASFSVLLCLVRP